MQASSPSPQDASHQPTSDTPAPANPHPSAQHPQPRSEQDVAPAPDAAASSALANVQPSARSGPGTWSTLRHDAAPFTPQSHQPAAYSGRQADAPAGAVSSAPVATQAAAPSGPAGEAQAAGPAHAGGSHAGPPKDLAGLRRFLKSKPQKGTRPTPVSEEVEGRDELLLRLITEDALRTIDAPHCSRGERYWLHNRANMLGFTTETTNRGANDLATVRVTKPEGWAMPAQALAVPAPPQQGRRRKHSAAKAEKRAKMEAWRTECEECGEELDAYSALYHHSGLGPMCENCVMEDDYLEGLKWEAKAEFWY